MTYSTPPSVRVCLFSIINVCPLSFLFIQPTSSIHILFAPLRHAITSYLELPPPFYRFILANKYTKNICDFGLLQSSPHATQQQTVRCASRWDTFLKANRHTPHRTRTGVAGEYKASVYVLLFPTLHY